MFGGGHTIANTPLGGFGEVGRMGLSWLKKYLVNDSCYCPLLLDIPTTASDYETNIDCSAPTGVVDYINDLIVYPNPASGTITLRGGLAKNNIYKIICIHEDYHKVTDTVEKIDFKKIETITRLVFLTAWELANRDERIVVDKKEN